MSDEQSIKLVEESDSCGNSTQIIGLEFNIYDRLVRFRIAAAREQVRLADIVPLARKISTKLAIMVLGELRKASKFVPCRKGCAACCSYIVPLSVPEVFRLREDVLAMPTKQGRAALELSLDAAKKILDNKTGHNILKLTKTSGQLQMIRLSKWYAGLKLPCPFLSEGLCTIYEQRPTACREHIITGSASDCGKDGGYNRGAVRMPVSILEALGQLAGEFEDTKMEAVMLPLALPWAQENLERDTHKWLAVMMVERFAKIIKTMASKNSAKAAVLNCT